MGGGSGEAHRVRLLLIAGVMLWGLWGCGLQDYHAVQTRVSTCDVTERKQIEAIDSRTGYPFLSTPHRFDCYLDAKGQPVFVVENQSEASLESIIDNPIGAAITKGIPSTVVPY